MLSGLCGPMLEKVGVGLRSMSSFLLRAVTVTPITKIRSERPRGRKELRLKHSTGQWRATGSVLVREVPSGSKKKLVRMFVADFYCDAMGNRNECADADAILCSKAPRMLELLQQALAQGDKPMSKSLMDKITSLVDKDS